MPKEPFFIKERDFKKYTEILASAYITALENINKNNFFSNSIDPFKFQFDISVFGKDAVIKNELYRQFDKTVNNAIGDFHQNILGSLDGWTNLGAGDKTGVDLCKNDKSIYIELKNKYNTMNSTSSAGTRKKLLAVLDKNNTCKAYWGYIIPRKSNKSGCTLWEKKNKKREVIHKHPRLYNIWGTELYKLVTGKEESLKLLNDKLDKFLDSSSKVKTCKDKVEKKIKAATKEIYSSTEFKNLFSLTFEEDS